MYKKIKILGRGAFGLVYKAENINNPGEYVAIKRYINISKKDIPYQILREISIIKLLKHPNIIEIKGTRNIKDKIELVLEYGGENIRSYYSRVSYSQRIREIKVVAYQILMSCLYMHKLGVIHRDLKPDNILIKYDENKLPIIKICDFGLAKKLFPFKNYFNSYQICTLCYRPPELFTVDNQNYSTAVDVWSLGCVLYEIIIKKPIFGGTTETTVLKNILSKVPITQEDLNAINLDHWKLEVCNTESYYKLPPLYDISLKDSKLIFELEELKDLVQSMITLNPDKRITLEKACQHKYFDSVRQNYNDLSCLLDVKKCRQAFYMRPELPKDFSIEERAVYVEHIMDWMNHYDLSEQTILMAIDIFDKFIYLCKKKRGNLWNDVNKDLKLIASCCLFLTSKYIDLTPLKIKNLESRHPKEQIILWEKIIAQYIEYDFNQPTLLNLYKEISNNNDIMLEEIPLKHWNIIKELILSYTPLQGQGIQEIKNILHNRIKIS